MGKNNEIVAGPAIPYFCPKSRTAAVHPSPQRARGEPEASRESALLQKRDAIVTAWLADYRRRLEESGRLKINAAMALGS